MEADTIPDRVITDFDPPPAEPLDEEILFPGKASKKKWLPDWKALRDHLTKEGKISKDSCHQLLNDTLSMLKKEPNLLKLKDPVTVVGDIHGQFYDFVKMLDVGGDPENTKYLFLGDYVDRGSFSVEVVLLVYAIKLNYPKTVFLLRGNHEWRQMTAFFNFRIEVLTKYDEETYNLFMDTFDTLPIGCLVNNKFLAIHGGISPDLKTLDDLNNIKRTKEPPRTGLFWDLLWSDPVEDDSGYCESLYKTNEVRGWSFFFGSEAASKFLKKNKLLSIIRAHEAQLEGYKMHKWNAKSGFPVVITIFSAPNYCDVYNNKGAIIKFKGAEINIQQFNYTPHPYILPNFMDVFSWSMPFVIEKVTEMLYNVLKYDSVEQEDEPEEVKDFSADKVKSKLNEEAVSTQKQRIQSLKQKIRSIGKMAIIFKTLREEHENITKLKGLCPGYKIPAGILSGGAGAIEEAVAQFEKAKKMDRMNEGMPEEMQIKK